MDFANAATLSLLVFVGVEIVKKVAPAGLLNARNVLLSALAVGIGATFLVAATVWGHEQVIGGHALDALDGWSKLTVGLFAGAGAVGIDKLFGAVKSIGENQPE